MKTFLVTSLCVMLAFCGCKKNNPLKKNEEAYCIYENVSPGVKAFLECVKTMKEAQDKCVQYRDSGKSVESNKKSSCSDC